MICFKWNKNWLPALLVSALAIGLVTPAEAAGKSTRVTKAKVSAKASTRAEPRTPTKGARKARTEAARGKDTAPVSRQARSKPTRTASDSVDSRSRAVKAARALPRAEAPARLIPVSVQSSSLTPHVAPNTAAMAAASGASGASFGQLYGLHQTPDPLELKSSVALVMDQDTNEVLLAKNSDAILPIASLTKLMTALVTVEARLSMDESITITVDDVDTEKNSSSRLAVGSTLTRGELLHLALMASENRAAHALGRSYPGGMRAFVSAMNAKARLLGMGDTRYVEPTGLSSRNQSSAKDLASLAKAAYQHPLIRELSTSREYAARVGSRTVQFHNTNGLIRNPSWDIGLQKTGYIVEAGRCLVMQASMAGRKLIMVFLDSAGKYSRLADAERVRRWIERPGHSAVEPSAEVNAARAGGKLTS
ncbi:D-alanyl-D-alanine endopeptidase [uncultured Aquabacterium sp.]|uniref:D-alanyl-D-alanine endopeptidase n=1 Tax=Aquabacterium sp. TaxID=1872578 RepID=UPI0026015A0F|nr:D-alanyl-D-alanine endopeptidase [uncultured Aquabacterium sp.]